MSAPCWGGSATWLSMSLARLARRSIASRARTCGLGGPSGYSRGSGTGIAGARLQLPTDCQAAKNWRRDGAACIVTKIRTNFMKLREWLFAGVLAKTARVPANLRCAKPRVTSVEAAGQTDTQVLRLDLVAYNVCL